MIEGEYDNITYDIEAFNELKDEYENIPEPEDALERIKIGSAQEDKEQKLVVIAKRAALAAAVFLMVITALVNLGGSRVAYAIEEIPVIGAIARVMTFRNYEDRTNNFEIDVQIPQIDGNETIVAKPDEVSNSAKNLAQTNKTIEAYAQGLIDMYENDLKASNGEGNYSLESTYEIVRETDNYLVLQINTTLIMAGGAEYRKIFNIDKITGSIMSLADFFVEDSNYIDVISENIKEQMRAQMADDETVTYFIKSEGEEWGFDKITEDTQFYFTENMDLIISFDEYEVAPGSMGAVSFNVPNAVIANMLK